MLVEIVDVEKFDAVPIVENCLIERVCHTNIILAQRNGTFRRQSSRTAAWLRRQRIANGMRAEADRIK
ncbi:hypothetical protein [Xanthomonas fragariae]|uniref:hypothetical protein n=1 Tax=Xanthomonas fragariae TaxID=48664 RepID=UPI0015558850